MGAFAVGSARLADAVIAHDPPTAAEVSELHSRARALVDTLPAGAPARGVVSGGSGTNVSRLLSRDRTHPVTIADLLAGTALLQSRPAADLALDTGLTERRVRQLAAGIALVEALMVRYGLSVTEVSDAGLREGALLAMERFGSDWIAGLRGLTEGEHNRAARKSSDGA